MAVDKHSLYDHLKLLYLHDLKDEPVVVDHEEEPADKEIKPEEEDE